MRVPQPSVRAFVQSSGQIFWTANCYRTDVGPGGSLPMQLQLTNWMEKALSFVGRGDRRSDERKLSLWNPHDTSLAVATFEGNVPTLILSLDHRMVDWNTAFALCFQHLSELSKGETVDRWYTALSNFKSIGKRKSKVMGDKILPFMDRERIVTQSPLFGRIVLKRLMTPIIDRTTGKTVGWTLTMNIVSITKRQKFFEILEGAFRKEASEKKFLYSYAPFFGAVGVYHDLIRGLTKGLSGNILVIGEMHGLISAKLAENPMIRKIYILSRSKEELRLIRDRLPRDRKKFRLVHRENSLFDGPIPENFFDHFIFGFGSSMELKGIKNHLLILTQSLKQDASLRFAVLRSDAQPALFAEAVRTNVLGHRSSERPATYDLNHILEMELKRAETLGLSAEELKEFSSFLSAHGIRQEGRRDHRVHGFFSELLFRVVS